MSTVKRLVNLFRRNVTHRHYQEIHVETVLNPEVFNTLLDYAKVHRETMLMLTGPYEPWIKARIQAENITDKNYIQALTEKYAILATATDNFGLHVHLFHPQSIQVPSFKWQFNKIVQALQFITDLGFKIRDFAPGWWGYNMDSVRACFYAGIKRFHYDGLQNLDSYEDMEYVKVWRSCDDFQLVGA